MLLHGSLTSYRWQDFFRHFSRHTSIIINLPLFIKVLQYIHFMVIVEGRIRLMRRTCTLDRIQIKNVRSLKDTGLQQIAPITVLVGENSSGKSTFLRVFPLLKQSISKRTSVPLLWAGDVDDYVDFGSFEETVTNDGSKEIEFSFQFDLQVKDSEIDAYGFLFPSDDDDGPSSFHITYTFAIEPTSDRREQVSHLSLRINDYSVLFHFGNHTGRKKTEGVEFQTGEMPSAEGSIFGFRLPGLAPVWDDINKEFFGDETDDQSDKWFNQIVQQTAVRYVGKCLCEGMQVDNLLQVIDSRLSGDDGVRRKFVRKAVQKIISAYNNSENQPELANTLQRCFLYSIFGKIEDYLRTYFKQIHYIAPVRATAERYYRLRNLAVDEVDYQGKNLPVFINSLSGNRLRAFQKWTLDNFGFEIVTSPSEGHLSLKIKLKNSDKEINLSDTGFGYSQILPIITQIWELSTRKGPKASLPIPLVVAIEQPELHLHPFMQAQLAKAFIAGIRLAESNGYQMQLILETHSEIIVNYFSKAIVNGTLRKDEAAIILFEKDPETNLTKVDTSTYNEEGYLENWPIGFLAPGD